jgi:NAD(P)-dependent dehydrogenase (short-subunit alcohol dehydrogenase family)
MSDPRLALVTGGSKGLGKDVVLAFAKRGFVVAVGYKTDRVVAEETALEAEGGAFTIGFDVCDRDACRDAVELLKPFGILDVVVNCAGASADGYFPLQNPIDADEMLNVNLVGTMNVCRSVVRGMLSRGRGAIVNVASAVALRSSPGRVAYASAKGGVLAFTHALAFEVAHKGVRVNAVVPGILGASTKAEAVEEAKKRVPLRRLAMGSEIAQCVAFLASDEASYVTGAALVVDGGLTL